MERPAVVLLLLLALCAVAANPALARRSSRRLDGGYTKSSSSPSSQTPYTTPSSGSSPSISTPSSTPSVPSITIPPVTSTPTTSSPVIIPPVTSTPTGRYGGYGSHTGKGTSGFLSKIPSAIPKVLSLVSTIAKLFGPRLLKFFKGTKAPGVYGTLKDTSTLPVPSLAREGTAAFINAYKYQDFPLTTGEVITQFNAALDSPQLAAAQALQFQQLNEGV